ncbi:immunoglobulin-like domain-containing protein [Bacillus sp. FJAT-42315]|uniref:immunoglobulin-like domain-containing protein n=1 Tax=Bacillus sp. FJAT-42315 TaxID=2014077 RepID=UPI000C2425A0|nr:immunoglobulin-like domain-containing protein [Bacillus sp. FJAT-42315]
MNRRKSLFLLILMLSFLLAACQSLDEKLTEKAETQKLTHSQNGISIRIDKEQYPVSVDELVVTIKNSTDKDINIPSEASIEKNINDVWYQIPKKENKREEAAQKVLLAQKTTKETFSLDHLEEKLDSGHYRIILPFYKDNKLFYLTEPFELVEQ